MEGTYFTVSDKNKATVYFTISDVARLTGIPITKIRFWIRKGILLNSQKAGAIRLFTEEDLDRIKAMQLMRESGFTIEKCKTMIALLENPRATEKDITREINDQSDRIQKSIQSLRELKTLTKKIQNDKKP